MMITTAIVLALAANTPAINTAEPIFVARDGSMPLKQLERDVLENPTAEAVAKLQSALGYVELSLEGGGKILADPLAPPIGDFRTARILIESFSEIGAAKYFRDLSPEAQRAVRSQLGRMKGLDFSSDTKIGLGLATIYRFKAQGKQALTLSRDIPNGTLRETLLRNPMRVLTDEELKSSGEKTLPPGPPSCDLEIPSYIRDPAIRLEFYSKCTKALADFAQSERKLRDAALRKALDKLRASDKALDDLLGDGRTADSLPESLSAALEQQFVSGWRRNGYASEDEARSAWQNGIFTGMEFGFTLSSGHQFPNDDVPGILQSVFGTIGR